MDFTESKLQTIEKHMPSIIEQLLGFALDQKIDDKLATLVTQKDLATGLEQKLHSCVFYDYCKR
jgi:hypothetical protein